MLMLLAGCATFGGSKRAAGLPDIPPDLRVCFNQIVPQPKQGAMTDGDVIRLIAALKQSEAAKTECGKRLINWVDTVRARWNTL